MRARMSWPRSSVPNGWLQEGPSSCAPKSMSLIGTCHTSGPNATASSTKPRVTALATASRCRRNRRHVSLPDEACSPGPTRSGATLAVGDARVEPAIKEVGEQVEQDDQASEYKCYRHDHRRVVGEDRADQQRADPRNAKDLLGDDGAAEQSRHLQRDQGYDRNQSIA